MADDEEHPYQSPLSAVPLPDQWLTRRRLLAGAGGLVAAGAADLVPIDGVAGWSPEPDTWPLARHDLTNAASTAARPPRDPTVAWTADGPERDDGTTLVVGPTTVYAGGSSVAALERATGEVAWRRTDLDGGLLALRDDTLYGATATEHYGLNGEDAGVFALDTDSGDTDWLVGLPGDDGAAATAASLLVADGTVFVGHEGDFTAYDAGTGSRRFRAERGNTVRLALDGGTLFATTGLGRVVRYAARDLLDVTLGDGPSPRWSSDAGGTAFLAPPVVGDSYLFCARLASRAAAGLVARSPATGAVEWTALARLNGSADDGLDTGVFAYPPAVADGTAVTAVAYGGEASPPSAVVALNTAAGTVRWRDPLGTGDPVATAVADDIALAAVAFEDADNGEVRAYGLASGERHWRVELPASPTALAAVEGTVFVTDRDGTVHALRD